MRTYRVEKQPSQVNIGLNLALACAKAVSRFIGNHWLDESEGPAFVSAVHLHGLPSLEGEVSFDADHMTVDATIAEVIRVELSLVADTQVPWRTTSVRFTWDEARKVLELSGDEMLLILRIADDLEDASTADVEHAAAACTRVS